MEVRDCNPSLHLPPGFRFHPSDEELIIHYLQNKVTSKPLPASIIAEIDLYKYNPWELPKQALFGDDEWFFFSPRDRKYPNGARPNRAAGSGYWKATGTDKPILTSSGSKSIGVKKSLVFYIGRPPKGTKTNWIMNEYRLLDTMIKPTRSKGSMRLDDWVLCRVRKKDMIKNMCEIQDSNSTESMKKLPRNEAYDPKFTDNKNEMITDFINQECQLLAFILANQALTPMETIPSGSFNGSKTESSFTSVPEDSLDKRNPPITVFSLESGDNPQKRKPSMENGYEDLLPSSKKINDDNRNEDLLHSNTLVGDDITNYSQNQSPCSIYNPHSLDPIIDFLEFNELTFTDKYLQ